MRIITAEDLAASGPIIQTLFAAEYPDGLTREELLEEAQKPSHKWLLRALERMEAGT